MLFSYRRKKKPTERLKKKVFSTEMFKHAMWKKAYILDSAAKQPANTQWGILPVTLGVHQ